MSGHTRDRCYKIHGYLPNHIGGNRRFANVAHSGEEEACVENDSMYTVFTPAQYKQILALLHKEKGEATSALFSNDEQKLDNTTFLASTLCLFSSRVVGWNINTGATNHMCYDLSLFSSFKTINENEHNIMILDRRRVKVKYVGEVKLRDDLLLKNVLYVHGFRFNLVSVHILIQDMNYVMSFTPNFCTI